jgi:hypothetical protein
MNARTHGSCRNQCSQLNLLKIHCPYHGLLTQWIGWSRLPVVWDVTPCWLAMLATFRTSLLPLSVDIIPIVMGSSVITTHSTPWLYQPSSIQHELSYPFSPKQGLVMVRGNYFPLQWVRGTLFTGLKQTVNDFISPNTLFLPWASPC